MVLVITGMTLACLVWAQAENEAQTLELGRAFTEQLYDEEFAALAERFSDDMRGAMDAEALAALWQRLNGQIGSETRLLEETASVQLGFNVYRRSALFGEETRVVLQWVLSDEGVIEGFSIRPD